MGVALTGIRTQVARIRISSDNQLHYESNMTAWREDVCDKKRFEVNFIVYITTFWNNKMTNTANTQK